jgi:hypothetical protein
VGFVPEVAPDVGSTNRTHSVRSWLQPTNPSNIDKQLEELEHMRDIAPGWYALARRIVEDE